MNVLSMEHFTNKMHISYTSITPMPVKHTGFEAREIGMHFHSITHYFCVLGYVYSLSRLAIFTCEIE